ncbi:l-a virus gag protein n-acetyltransferase protein [Pyrenophora tritici-repentis]|nr:l-a virus gag protein n-acetyltransferase protein [Pyrenophora tritici-repentis]KAI0615242.1 l-a virus gag protein n-acetyltransferase protein [Pyrenophora tritici-repentis]KAI0627302.1 l-a virus gag protein n-acetyltransferase protein [Pyrenophora tritici-repentis]KAI2485916.1 l-a virus gag protein n-acetyltransferase protein [Pyrenophora tritici-repentis]
MSSPAPAPPVAHQTQSKPNSSASNASPTYIQYDASKEEQYLPAIRQLISKDLSEPYSIYVYRYFLYQWGDLCYMALTPTITPALIGVITCKLEPHRSGTYRGYIAMLATQEEYRGRGIATQLVRLAIEAMTARDADEIVLETEVSNTASLKLYERLGFIRSKRLHRYYLNGNAAFRLILYLKEGTALKRPDMLGGGDGHGAVETHQHDMRRVDEADMYS